LDWWPCYFAAEDIALRNLAVKRNALFPYQRKSVVRDFLRGLEPNIDRMPLNKVRYLRVLLLPAQAYREVVATNADYDTALAILRRRAGAQP
jgi:hypothetical protein